MSLEAPRRVYGLMQKYGQGLIDNIDPQKVFVPLAERGSHPAWIFGHLCWSGLSMASMLGDEPAGAEAQALAPLFGEKVDVSPSATRYPSWREITEQWRKTHERLDAAAAHLPAERLADATPIAELAETLPTVGDLVTFMLSAHEAMHLGQISAWRRAQGMPPLF